MRILMILVLILSGAVAATAQDGTNEEDKGRITRYLEEALSGLGREVRIDGFRGALSSRVSMERLTVTDDQGVWLTLTDAVLDWNRASILRGRINITQISAAKIDVARVPVSEEPASPEAAGSFSLPDLPVSIDIQALTAGEVSLGPTILGEAVVFSVDGALTLAEGEGTADLTIERQDGPRGLFDLAASYGNSTRQLALDLTLDEAEEGIAATLLNLPGKPALQLTVAGDAPIDEFVAEIALKSDGQDRLAGRVSTQLVSAEGNPEAETEALPRVILVDIAGDLAPLFAPEYQPFFGNDVGLQSLVQLFPDGRVSLETLTLKAAALLLEGTLDVAANGLPERFDFKGVVEDPGGEKVILPLSGPETQVQRAAITALFDASEGEAWILKADLSGFERPDASVDKVEIAANGTIASDGGRSVTARIDSLMRGIALADEALAEAVGESATLGGDIVWTEGGPLRFTDVTFEGGGMAARSSGQVDGLESAVTIDGELSARIEDIARFSGLVGRPLSGSVEATLSGQAAVLTGAFDVELDAEGRDLVTGIEQVDKALAGQSKIAFSGKRDEDGLTLRNARLTTPEVNAGGKGILSSDTADFEFDAAVTELARFVQGIAGAASVTGTATQDQTGWKVAVDGNGPFQSRATGLLTLSEGGEPNVKLEGVIGNVAGLVPELPGSAEFVAELQQQGDTWLVETSGTGPGGSTFAIGGQVAADASRAALDIDGTLPLELANAQLRPTAAQGQARFDLRLDGPLEASSLSGRLSTSGARVSLPALQNALTDIDATIDLSGTTAAIKTNAALATGGQLTVAGTVGTSAPFSTNLGIKIVNATLRDPQLYETTVRGDLALTGTAPQNLNIAGQVNLDRTEIRVPSTGLGGGAIPEINHVNEPRGVRQTRRVAGLIPDEDAGQGGSGGADIGLNILIIADNQVFVRGRGLDAELGGRFRITGSTADIVPIGGIDLIRGRLDILGKRLTMDEGAVRMLGDFIPNLRLVASTLSEDDTVVRIVIEGRADEPEVRFLSEPSLPEDEVLARLLFGRDLSSLSAFQALQLASAVATLAGRGGTSLAERLRQSTGLDDVSVSTDSEGQATLGVGKYISDNIYTDVQIGDQNNTEINLNIDLSRRTKVRGSFGSDGSTGVGVFFEKDY